jgi:hypothetical protein
MLLIVLALDLLVRFSYVESYVRWYTLSYLGSGTGQDHAERKSALTTFEVVGSRILGEGKKTLKHFLVLHLNLPPCLPQVTEYARES